jgi:predicted amidohydrolase
MGTSTRVDDLADASALRLRKELLRRAVGAGDDAGGAPAREVEAAWAAVADLVPEALEEWRDRTRHRVRRAQVSLMEEQAAVATLRGWLTRCARSFLAQAQTTGSPVLADALRQAADVVVADVDAVIADVAAVHGTALPSAS